MKKLFFLPFLLLLFSFTYNEKFSDTKWLEEHSMIQHAKEIDATFSGEKIQWQYPYGKPKPVEFVSEASVWFTAYPLSTITKNDESVLQALGSEKLWKFFQEIGIEAIHTGPMKLAGGFEGKKRTPSIDGGFDRIAYTIDPTYGSEKDYHQMKATAAKYGGCVIGDIIPAHTGRGADFLLALQNYKSYPGLYHIIEINEDDWNILPNVPENELSINLKRYHVDQLSKKGYIVGRLEQVIFFQKGIKETNWDVTRPILGADGKKRRWVYLHYFKSGQPSLNWLDPTMNANKIINTDITHSIRYLGCRAVRFDATPFLGIERKANSRIAISTHHPLALISTSQIAMMTRKLGGYSFQELNSPIDSIHSYMQFGPDLSYDFITRAPYLHAILFQDPSLLKMMIKRAKNKNLQQSILVHALQNHDEFNTEYVEFHENPKEYFLYKGKNILGQDLFKQIKNKEDQLLYSKKYNLYSNNGPCTTMVGIAATALNIQDLSQITKKQKEEITKIHLLATAFNALQPGVFALSGWDLVGAYPLDEKQIESLSDDMDKRWANRGAYNLLGDTNNQQSNVSNIPKAQMLYGSLPEQLQDKNSYCSQLKKLLQARKQHKIMHSQFLELPT
nr:alpha-amylase family glycosyl hydrolase [Chlamydiales bacterium]